MEKKKGQIKRKVAEGGGAGGGSRTWQEVLDQQRSWGHHLAESSGAKARKKGGR